MYNTRGGRRRLASFRVGVRKKVSSVAVVAISLVVTRVGTSLARNSSCFLSSKLEFIGF